MPTLRVDDIVVMDKAGLRSGGYLRRKKSPAPLERIQLAYDFAFVTAASMPLGFIRNPWTEFVDSALKRSPQRAQI